MFAGWVEVGVNRRAANITHKITHKNDCYIACIEANLARLCKNTCDPTNHREWIYDLSFLPRRGYAGQKVCPV